MRVPTGTPTSISPASLMPDAPSARETVEIVEPSLTPLLRLRGVKVANTDWGEAPYVAQLEELMDQGLGGPDDAPTFGFDHLLQRAGLALLDRPVGTLAGPPQEDQDGDHGPGER